MPIFVEVSGADDAPVPGNDLDRVNDLVRQQRERSFDGKNRKRPIRMSKEQRRSKMTALREEQNKKLKEILTPDQYEKWEKMRQQFRPHRGEGGNADKKAE